MTFHQWLSIAMLAVMMALFLWGRFRYDVTAVISLLLAIAVGVVPVDQAFIGFSDDIVMIVGSALVLSAAVQRSGAVEIAMGWLAGRVQHVPTQLLALTAAVGFSSALVKNVGALAMLMPAAFQMARRTQTSPSVFLMPMAFASLLGGLMTLIGTSPNIIVSKVRMEMTGQPFRMFDYLPTGLALLLLGLVFLRFAFRLLPAGRQPRRSLGETLNISGYVTQATITAGSEAVGDTIADFEERHGREVQVSGMMRGDMQGAVSAGTHLMEGDVLILSGQPDALERAIARDSMELVGTKRTEGQKSARDEIGVVEAVVNTDAAMIGRTARRLQLRERFGINLIAVSRQGETLVRKLGDIVFQPGDVVVLQGSLAALPDQISQLGALPLAQRTIRLGSDRRMWLPLSILAAAMLATASGYVPVALGFFAAAALVVLTGALPVSAAYQAVEWPILIMLAALIPVSASLQATGASDVIASELAVIASELPPWGAVALILVAAMAVTPFLNNAATVLVMAPIAGVFAHDLGYRPEAFLIATAIGAGCDFLTPIGHQCNTLVLGPGGYKFGDYARLGAPLSLLVVLVGTPLILWFWPV